MRARPNRWPVMRVAVAEESMTPGLRPGDWVLAWRTARIRPGQVVLAWHPQRPGFLLVKRVAWREADGWWLVSDNPVAGAVDSARFGPVPGDHRPSRRGLPFVPEPFGIGRQVEQRLGGDMDLARVAAGLLGVPVQHRDLVREHFRRSPGIPVIGVPGRDAQRALLTAAADQQRQPVLDRAGWLGASCSWK